MEKLSQTTDLPTLDTLATSAHQDAVKKLSSLQEQLASLERGAECNASSIKDIQQWVLHMPKCLGRDCLELQSITKQDYLKYQQEAWCAIFKYMLVAQLKFNKSEHVVDDALKQMIPEIAGHCQLHQFVKKIGE